jgi:hypothetical protein
MGNFNVEHDSCGEGSFAIFYRPADPLLETPTTGVLDSTSGEAAKAPGQRGVEHVALPHGPGTITMSCVFLSMNGIEALGFGRGSRIS